MSESHPAQWRKMGLEARVMLYQKLMRARDRQDDMERCEACRQQAAFCDCADLLAHYIVPELFHRYIELAGVTPRPKMQAIREGWAARKEVTTADNMGLVDWR